MPEAQKDQAGREFMRKNNNDLNKGECSVNVKVEGPSVRLDKVARAASHISLGVDVPKLDGNLSL